jgi:hypothetical protein
VLCSHPKREALNEAIAMGTATMTQIAQQIGVNKSAVSRHFRRHLEPAITAAGGSPAVAWNVRLKSRQLAERMELLLSKIMHDSETGSEISERELLKRWQAVRALGSEMREWVRLHAQSTGELGRDPERHQAWCIQIISPGVPANGPLPKIAYQAEAEVVEIGLIQQRS